MTDEEQRLRKQRFERIARTKRLLRWLPRHSNVHTYPVLKWFANSARKRLYLWSFRVQRVVPALWAGCVLSLLPLYGVQLVIAVGLAFLLRCNLPILFGLQFISNPLTLIPLYYANYQVARIVANLFGYAPPPLNQAEMARLVHSVIAGDLPHSAEFLARVFALTSLGGLILGLALGALTVTAYNLSAREVARSYERLKHLQYLRQQRQLRKDSKAP